MHYTVNGVDKSRKGLHNGAQRVSAGAVMESLPFVEGDERKGVVVPPPESNTGAQTAQVDWLGVTFADASKVSDVTDLLGGGTWIEMPRGGMGYRQGLVRGNVRVLFDGQRGMGVHVEASGQGCRELEASGAVSDWQAFLKSVLGAGGRVSRLDLAIDDRIGMVKLDKVQDAIRAQEVVSRYREYQVQSSGCLQGGDQGTTVYFGAASSSTRVRMYDKAAQLGLREHWTRVELQARDERAMQLAAAVVAHGAGVVAGVLKGLIDFKVKGAHSQRERWATADWWTMFLACASRVALTVAKVGRRLENVAAWVERQVAPSLAALVEALGGDVSWLLSVVDGAKWRLRPEHRAMIAAYTVG